MKKIVSLLLVLGLVLGLVACGAAKPAETQAPTEAPAATEAPVVETEAPETEAPAVDDGEVPTGLVVENGVFKSLNLDFETALSVPEYIASFEGFGTNAGLRGGEIKDGKWVYTNASGFAIEDSYGIYHLDKYSIEFDFCFDAYIDTANAASIFTIITDEDNKLGGDSGFYFAFRMTSDGNVFHGGATDKKFQVELGKTHHYKIEIDSVAGTANVYFDGNHLSTASFSESTKAYNCFRFLDQKKGATVWMDNIVIKNLAE